MVYNGSCLQTIQNVRMNPNLLVTKILVPSRRGDVLRRQRLLDFIHEYIGRKLVLISASAGYGKTSLIVDFANDTSLPVCWYSVEESDGDPQVFLEYLVAAIQRDAPSEDRAGVLSLNSLLFRLAFVLIGPAVGAGVDHFGMPPVLGVIAAASGVTCLASYAAFRRA